MAKTTTTEPWDLWLAYQAEPSDELRNELTMHHLLLAHNVALKQWKRFGKRFSVEELVSAGVEGLMQAIEGFDAGRGWNFSTYAQTRIFGAIIDYVRECDHVPRVIRQHHKLIAEAAAAIEEGTGRPATREQLRRAVTLTDDQFEAAFWIRDTSSIDAVVSESEAGNSHFHLRDLLVDSSEVERVRHARNREAVMNLLPGCSQQERLLLLLYWIEGWSMKRIGDDLGLSESRISQMHTRLLARLRERANPPPPAPAQQVARAEMVSLCVMEQRAIEESLTRHAGNKVLAASELGISLKSLYNKLHTYGLAEKYVGLPRSQSAEAS